MSNARLLLAQSACSDKSYWLSGTSPPPPHCTLQRISLYCSVFHINVCATDRCTILKTYTCTKYISMQCTSRTKLQSGSRQCVLSGTNQGLLSWLRSLPISYLSQHYQSTLPSTCSCTIISYLSQHRPAFVHNSSGIIFLPNT